MNECTQWHERIADRAAGALDQRSGHEVDRHLGECSACRRVAAEYETLLTAYRSADPESPGASIDDRLLSMAAKGTDAPRADRSAIRLLIAAAALLAVTWGVIEMTGRGAGAPHAIDPSNLDAILAEATRLHNAGEADGAIAQYERIIDQLPEDPRVSPAYHGLASLYAEQGDIIDAIEMLESIVELFPGYPARDEVLFLLAESFERVDRDNLAIETYDRLIREFPDQQERATARLAEMRHRIRPEEIRMLEKLGYIK